MGVLLSNAGLCCCVNRPLQNNNPLVIHDSIVVHMVKASVTQQLGGGSSSIWNSFSVQRLCVCLTLDTVSEIQSSPGVCLHFITFPFTPPL